MREIKFRGKRVDTKEWVYGNYFIDERDIEDGFIWRDIPQIQQRYGDHYQYFDVIPETIGQYTGLKDKNGKEIYEGDILQVETGWYKSNKNSPNDKFDNRVKGITYWTVEHKIHSCKVGYMAYGIDRRFNRVLTPSMIFNNKAEVVGDVYTNPDLLKEVTDEA